jgi:hypothetical protein
MNEAVMNKKQGGLGYFVYLFTAFIIISHITNDVLDLPWYSAALVAGALGAAAYYLWIFILKFLNK